MVKGGRFPDKVLQSLCCLVEASHGLEVADSYGLCP